MDEYGEQQTMQFDVGLSNLASSGLDCTSQCCYQPPPQQIVYSPAAVPATVPTGDYWQPMYPYTRGLDNQCASQIVNSPSQPAPSIGTSSRVPHSPARKSMRQIVTKEEKQLICLEFETGTKQSDLSRIWGLHHSTISKYRTDAGQHPDQLERLKQLGPHDVEKAILSWESRVKAKGDMIEERRKQLFRVLNDFKHGPQKSNAEKGLWAGSQTTESQAPIHDEQPKLDCAQGSGANGVDEDSFSGGKALLSSCVTELVKSVLANLVSDLQSTAQRSKAGVGLTFPDDTASYPSRRQRAVDLKDLRVHDCNTPSEYVREQSAVVRSTSEQTEETEEDAEVMLGREIHQLRKENKRWKDIFTSFPGKSERKCKKAHKKWKHQRVAHLYQRKLALICRRIAEDVGMTCDEVHEIICSLGDKDLATRANGELAA